MMLSKLILKRGKDGFFSSDMKRNNETKCRSKKMNLSISVIKKKKQIDSERELKILKWKLF